MRALLSEAVNMPTCRECGKSFTRNDNLKRHYKLLHQETDSEMSGTEDTASATSAEETEESDIVESSSDENESTNSEENVLIDPWAVMTYTAFSSFSDVSTEKYKELIENGYESDVAV